MLIISSTALHAVFLLVSKLVNSLIGTELNAHWCIVYSTCQHRTEASRSV